LLYESVGVIEHYICVCGNDDGEGGQVVGSVSDCFTFFSFDASDGTYFYTCTNMCCDVQNGQDPDPEDCEDLTLKLVFPTWTDACYCDPH